MESSDLSGLIFDDGLKFVVESLLLGQFVIEVINLLLKGRDGLREMIVVLLKLGVVQLEALDLLGLPSQLLLEFCVLFHEFLQSSLILL